MSRHAPAGSRSVLQNGATSLGSTSSAMAKQRFVRRLIAVTRPCLIAITAADETSARRELRNSQRGQPSWASYGPAPERLSMGSGLARVMQSAE